MNKPISQRFHIKVREASMKPPLGPWASKHKLRGPDLCKKINDAMKDFKPDLMIPVDVYVLENNKFSIFVHKMTMTDLIKQKINCESGSSTPGRTNVGTITKDQVKEIAIEKLSDLNTVNIESAMNTVIASAKSLGITCTD